MSTQHSWSTRHPWSIEQLKAAVPDVRCPLISISTTAGGRDVALHQRQRQRRAMILCTARAQIDDGLTEINVRHLAERCEVCVQTVHNLVGAKDDILTAAVDEHYKRMLSALDRFDAGERVFELLADILWFLALQNPSYIKALSRRYFERPDRVHSVIDARIRDAFMRAMVIYVGGRDSRVDCRGLAGKMHALIAISSLEWVHERTTIEDLRERLSSDFELVLNAAVHTHSECFG